MKIQIFVIQEDEEEEVDHLCKEASMPIEQVIAKYNGETNGHEDRGVNLLFMLILSLCFYNIIIRLKF